MSSFSYAHIFGVAAPQPAQAAPAARGVHGHAVWIHSSKVMQDEPRSPSDANMTLKFCGVVAMPDDAEQFTPLEQLLISSGALKCSCEITTMLQPPTVAKLAAALCMSPSLSLRVGAAHALRRYASLDSCDLSSLLQPTVFDALCAALSDFDFAREDVPLAPAVAARLQQAGGSAHALSSSHAVTHERLAELIREEDSAPADFSASDVLALCKLHVKILCLATLVAILQTDSDSESPSQLAMVDALYARGVFAHICTLGDAGSWSGAHGAVIPATAAKMCADLGMTLASWCLQHIVLRGRRHSTVHSDEAVAETLTLALTNGGGSSPRLRERGLAAMLLSYVASNNTEDNKEVAVKDGALVWLLSVATAEDVYSEFICGRAIAAAGNLSIAARYAAELEPLLHHLLHVMRTFVASPAAMVRRIIDPISSPLYCATFALGQLAAIEQMRPLLDQEGAQRLLSQVLVLVKRERSLALIEAIITTRTQILMLQPPLLYLRRSYGLPSARSVQAAQILREAFGVGEPRAPTAETPVPAAAPPSAAAAATPAPATTSAPPQQQRTCGGCGAVDAQHVFKLCAACKAVRYCGDACQKRAWPQHKQACRAHVWGGE